MYFQAGLDNEDKCSEKQIEQGTAFVRLCRLYLYIIHMAVKTHLSILPIT